MADPRKRGLRLLREAEKECAQGMAFVPVLRKLNTALECFATTSSDGLRARTYVAFAELFLREGKEGYAKKAFEYWEKAAHLFGANSGRYEELATKLLGRLRRDGDTCKENGEFDRAFELFKCCQAISERHFGNESHQVAEALNNKAIVHSKKGNYNLALELFERLLGITERQFGKDSHQVADTLHNMAIVHQEKGEYDLALQLFERALPIFEQSFGIESRPSFSVHSQIANTQIALHDRTEACQYLLIVFRGGITNFTALVRDRLATGEPLIGSKLSLLDLDDACQTFHDLLHYAPPNSDFVAQATEEIRRLRNLQWDHSPLEKRALLLVLNSIERTHAQQPQPLADPLTLPFNDAAFGPTLTVRWEVLMRLVDRLLRNLGRDMLLGGRLLSARTRNLAVQFFVDVRSLLDLAHAMYVKRSGLVKADAEALLPVVFSLAAFQDKLAGGSNLERDNTASCRRWVFSTADFLRLLPEPLYDHERNKINDRAAGEAYSKYRAANPDGCFRDWLLIEYPRLDALLPASATEPTDYALRLVEKTNRLVFQKGVQPQAAQLTGDHWLQALRAHGILVPLLSCTEDLNENGEALATTTGSSSLLEWCAWRDFERAAVEGAPGLSAVLVDQLERYWPLARLQAPTATPSSISVREVINALYRIQPFSAHPTRGHPRAPLSGDPSVASSSPRPAASTTSSRPAAAKPMASTSSASTFSTRPAATAAPTCTTIPTAPAVSSITSSASSSDFSWLEVANAVNNEIKHVRLTVQGIQQDLTKQLGALSVRNTSLRIFFTEQECHYWSFVPCCDVLPAKDRLEFSRCIRRFLDKDENLLVTGGKVNSEDPLIQQYVQLKRACVSPQCEAAVASVLRGTTAWGVGESAKAAVQRTSEQFKQRLHSQLRSQIENGFGTANLPNVSKNLAELCCDRVADVLLYKALYPTKLHLREKNPVEEMGVDLLMLLDSTLHESRRLIQSYCAALEPGEHLQCARRLPAPLPEIANGRPLSDFSEAQQVDPVGALENLRACPADSRFARAATLIESALGSGRSVVPNAAWLAQYVCKLAAEMYAPKRNATERTSKEHSQLDERAADACSKRCSILLELRLDAKAEVLSKQLLSHPPIPQVPYPVLCKHEPDLVEQAEFAAERFYCGVLPSALKGRVLFESTDPNEQEEGYQRLCRAHTELYGMLVRLRGVLDHAYLRAIVVGVYNILGASCKDTGFPCVSAARRTTDGVLGQMLYDSGLSEDQRERARDLMVAEEDGQLLWKNDWKEFGDFVLKRQNFYANLKRICDRYKHENLDLPDATSLRAWFEQDPRPPVDDAMLLAVVPPLQKKTNKALAELEAEQIRKAKWISGCAMMQEAIEAVREFLRIVDMLYQKTQRQP